MNQIKELQAFFKEFGYQIYDNINPNANGDQLKRNILLNRFLNPDKTTFMPFVINNIEQLSAYFQNEFTQKTVEKTELPLSQEIDAQLRKLGITFSENEINHLINGEKIDTKLTLKKQGELTQNQYNTIAIKLNSINQNSTLSIKFQRAKIIIPKEIAQNISKNDRKMMATMIKNQQSFTFNIPNTNTALRFGSLQKPIKEVKEHQIHASIFSEEKQHKFKL